ncbi:MAG: hypothetical protein HZA83_03255 [Thaumarchaeota archaeon]|nr:hypothetical protein [Nitrososphaerota archaeon]
MVTKGRIKLSQQRGPSLLKAKQFDWNLFSDAGKGNMQLHLLMMQPFTEEKQGKRKL